MTLLKRGCPCFTLLGDGQLGHVRFKKNEILRLMGTPQCLIFGKYLDLHCVAFFILGFVEALSSKRRERCSSTCSGFCVSIGSSKLD